MQNHIQAILLIKKQILSVKTFLSVHTNYCEDENSFLFSLGIVFPHNVHPLSFSSKQKSDHEKRESYSSLIEIISL